MGSGSRKILSMLAVLAVVAVAAPLTGSFGILLAAKVLLFAMLAMSVDLLLGYTGLPSLGHAAYLGIGAYATGILAAKYHLGLGCGILGMLPLGLLLGAMLAAVFGLFALRTSGVYFLIITLALGQCVWGLAYRWNSLTGGDNGINVLSRPVCVVDLSSDTTFFYVSLGLYMLMLGGLYTLVRSPFGRTLVGIKESESRMRMLGYNTWLHKYLAFIISGACAGFVGVLWVHLNGIVNPGTVNLTVSVDALLVVALGGQGTLVGALLGTAVVVFLRDYLSTQVGWWQYLLGGAYVLAILYLPDGLMSVPGLLRRRREQAPLLQGKTGLQEKEA